MNKSGFTLIELVVTVAIFALLTSVILARYPRFSSSAALGILAQDVALTIRQAQVFGLGVRGVETGSSQEFLSHGAHFDSQNTKSFVLFVDIPPSPALPGTTPIADKKYNPPVSDPNTCSGECKEKFNIQNPNFIDSICGDYKLNADSCVNPLVSLDIVFTRPNPEASIIGRVQGAFADQVFSDAAIIFKSTRDDNRTRAVVVWNTGQLTTQ